jgi:ABC-type uncharacterized transport system permease subunit
MKNFFTKLFSDNNDINEKSVVGFLAFLMMVVTLGVDIYTGVKGRVMPINEFVFNGFMVITLGSFGIASIDKWTVRKNQNSSEETTDINDITE